MFTGLFEDWLFVIFYSSSILLMVLLMLLALKRDLMMLQQNSNRNDRYKRWMSQSGESTRMPRLLAMILTLMPLVKFSSSLLASLCINLIILFAAANIISLVRAKYKKPLVFTRRAIRIYSVAIALWLLGGAVICAIFILGQLDYWVYLPCYLTACFAVSYWFILAANWLLKPIERRINKRYYDEAAQILASMPDLKVIGITGSYGKTSTKHYLHRILSEHFDVLMTPGNFNTTLGVIRTIREHMKPYNQVFIAEMGAKQVGDIKEICDLVHPTIGVVTAVGPQHLESFGSIENVQATKFELVDSLPADGLAVVNNDFNFIANRPVDNVKCIRYAADPEKPAQYHATDIRYTPEGTYFTITDGHGDDIRLYTRLVGEGNISNLMAAVIVARYLGVPDQKIRYAVEQIEQVEHRLSIKRTPAGITIIDDAYNSNPFGSLMALDVLSHMTSGKRIVITPGMIELGEGQYVYNHDFGMRIPASADVAIIVGEYNRQAIEDGINEAGGMPKGCVHYVATFNEAQQLMLSIARPGDTVLYENDLPDTFK